jgi:hypothetical protein
MGTGDFSPMVEADHSISTSAEVKKFMNLCRNNFTYIQRPSPENLIS